MSFDLSTLDTKAPAEAGIFVQLEHPGTKEPLFDDDGVTPFGITIKGGDSDKVGAKLRAIADRRLELIRKSQKLPDAEASRREDIATVAAATISWHLPPLGGEALECSEPNARKLYADPRFPWIMEQLEKAIGDRSRFFVPSVNG